MPSLINKRKVKIHFVFDKHTSFNSKAIDLHDKIYILLYFDPAYVFYFENLVKLNTFSNFQRLFWRCSFAWTSISNQWIWIYPSNYAEQGLLRIIQYTLYDLKHEYWYGNLEANVGVEYMDFFFSIWITNNPLLRCSIWQQLQWMIKPPRCKSPFEGDGGFIYSFHIIHIFSWLAV